MNFTLSDEKRILLTQFLLAGLIFFIPLSPTIKTIFLIASLIFIIITPQYNKYIPVAFKSIWGFSALLLFIFIALACLWSPASVSGQFSALDKYVKLLYLPILAAAFVEPRVRSWSITSFLLVMFLTCVVSIMQYLGILKAGEPGTVIYNYIITGFMLALTAYIALLYMLDSKGWPRVCYMTLALLCSFQVFFVNKGRTGYVVYTVLIALLLLQKLPIKKAALGLVLAIASIGLLYTQSNTMQTRVHAFVEDVRALQQNNKNTSIGYRMQFHQYAGSLFRMHPLLGNGTGSYRYHFVKDNPVPSWGVSTADPHGQYWMILAEFGLTGLLLLVIFLGSLLITGLQLKETRAILIGVLVSFSLACFSDTLLCFSAAGYLLIFFAALCFGEWLPGSNTFRRFL